MNIVLVTREEFPYGSAASNRVLTYMPGIAALGHKVTILCLFLSRKENVELLDEKGECEYNGVKIKYVGGNRPWPVGSKAYLSKVLLTYRTRLMAKKWIKHNRESIDIIQMYSTDISLYERYGKICKRLGIKYVIERSELPNIIKNKEAFNTSKGKAYIQRSERDFGLFDGWLLETQTLVDYYSRFFKTETKYVIVPMTVDVDRFTIAKNTNKTIGEYIAYCGNMCEIDGISILIKAYSIVRIKYPNIKLALAGDSPEIASQKKLAETLGVINDVLFLGRLSRDEVPRFLADATMLVLASPTSERASASMPCKVGEYLCTSNPVVVTGQGEIFKYLKDGESAFLAQPDSAEAFAETIESVLSDIPKALEVGKRGRQVAIDCFGAEAQVKRIESFYRSLIEV